MKKAVIYLAAAALAVQYASAVQIAPNSYVYSANPNSSYADSGNELTDAVLGAALGVSTAPWVGWKASSVNIDFSFDPGYSFNEVKVHTIQSGIANIPLPNVDVYGWNGLDWDLLSSVHTPEATANNGLRFITLGGFGEETTQLRVTLSQALDGPWTFASEVQFFGERVASNVPDGGSTALLLGLSALGLGMFKRKR